MPAICPEPSPDPAYFDAVVFFAECGDMAELADAAPAGELYRKTLLGLEPGQVADLRAHLARRGLALVDCGADWLFAPAEGWCPVCGQVAIAGRTTCGGALCLAEIGRRELADRRRKGE